MAQSKNIYLILIILFFTVLFDQSGILLIQPVLPELLHQITGQNISQNAQIGAYLAASYAVMQFIFGPIVGKLSDHFGRRKILIISSFVFIFDYLIMALAQDIWILFLGRVLAGITGAAVVTALACIADISNDDNRTKNFAIIYAAIGLGLIIGPIITSFSLRLGSFFELGIRAPFWMATIFALVNFIFILFLVPETLVAEKRNKLKLKENPFNPLLKFLAYPGLKYMFITHFITMIALQAPFILLPFFVEERLMWRATKISDLFIYLGIVMLFVQVVAVPKIYPLLGNQKICYLGLFLLMIGMLIMLWVDSTVVLYLAITVLGLSAISNSAFSSIYSSQVSESEQGELQGVIASIISLASIVSFILMGYVFKISVDNRVLFKEANPFLLAALLVIIAFIFLVFSFRKIFPKNKSIK